MVCTRWRDLYYSRDASPLHETLEVDFTWEGLWQDPHRVVRAESVIAWARRHAGDIRVLRLVSTEYVYPEDFTSESLATLVEVLGPHLTEIEVSWTSGPLAGAPFWDALREVVAPAGLLRKLDVAGIWIALAEGDALREDEADVSFLGQLARLEELTLSPRGDSGGGFRAFPASVLSLTALRRLDLSGHEAITSLPRGISALGRLEFLGMALCSLNRLPEELGALTRLTGLDLGWNSFGETAEGDAFPESLRDLTSLRSLSLAACSFRSVPSFIGDLEALEDLDLSSNEEYGRGGFPAEFPRLTALTRVNLSECSFASLAPVVVSSMPRLRSLTLSYNELARLPHDLGERLPDLREVDLGSNKFRRIPLRALAGATSLEKINFKDNFYLQVREPLDFLLDGFPRLREVRLRGRDPNQWTRASRAHLERFAERLRTRDSTAIVEF